MSSARYRIGFSSQRLRYEWVERSALMYVSGMGAGEIEEEIRDLLSNDRRGCALAGGASRLKAASLLRGVWIAPPAGARALRDSAADLMRCINRRQHLALHWAVVMAAYPFWAEVACEVGRLFRLQERVRAGQVRRRMVERYGERESVARATRCVLRSFVDWRVLEETGSPGAYVQAPQRHVDDVRLVSLLIEGLLRARSDGSMQLRKALASPSLFPFRLRVVSPGELVAAAAQLDAVGHGPGDGLIVVRDGTAPRKPPGCG